MKRSFEEALRNRRSYYVLGNEWLVPHDKIETMLGNVSSV